ncbi:hypothetical protein L6R52_14335 [Myxococcota bacterium]|nr:hypothetical protein [Myxococcota bacterium]
MKKQRPFSLASSLVLTLSALPSAAFASSPDGEDAVLEALVAPIVKTSVSSAERVREGDDVLAIGLAFFGPIPAVDVRYRRGLGEHTELDAALATAGVVQRLRFGGRYQLVGDAPVQVALRASILEVHAFDGDDRLAAGVGPGFVISFIEPAFTWTLSLDAAWSFADAGGFGPGRAVQVQPSLSIELPIEDDVAVHVEVTTLATLGTYERWVLPVVSASLAW